MDRFEDNIYILKSCIAFCFDLACSDSYEGNTLFLASKHLQVSTPVLYLASIHPTIKAYRRCAVLYVGPKSPLLNDIGKVVPGLAISIICAVPRDQVDQAWNHEEHSYSPLCTSQRKATSSGANQQNAHSRLIRHSETLLRVWGIGRCVL